MKPLKTRVRYYADARARAQRRKSPWNLLLLVLMFLCWCASSFVLFRAVWAFHVWLYPNHRLQDLGTRGMSSASNMLILLLILPLMLGSLGISFALVNRLMWLIPPARRAFDQEAEDYPETNFRESNRALSKITLWILPASIAVAMLAASLLKSFK
jgi:flagellar basal body-associated protein FliL